MSFRYFVIVSNVILLFVFSFLYGILEATLDPHIRREVGIKQEIINGNLIYTNCFTALPGRREIGC